MRLLAFLFALLIAAPAAADGWSTNQLYPGGTTTYNFQRSDGLGDSTTSLSLSNCNPMSLFFDSEGGAYELYSVDEADSDTSTGTLVASGVGDQSRVSVNSSTDWLRVKRTLEPDKPAKLTLYCEVSGASRQDFPQEWMDLFPEGLPDTASTISEERFATEPECIGASTDYVVDGTFGNPAPSQTDITCSTGVHSAGGGLKLAVTTGGTTETTYGQFQRDTNRPYFTFNGGQRMIVTAQLTTMRLNGIARGYFGWMWESTGGNLVDANWDFNEAGANGVGFKFERDDTDYGQHPIRIYAICMRDNVPCGGFTRSGLLIHTTDDVGIGDTYQFSVAVRIETDTPDSSQNGSRVEFAVQEGNARDRNPWYTLARNNSIPESDGGGGILRTTSILGVEGASINPSFQVQYLVRGIRQYYSWTQDMTGI